MAVQYDIDIFLKFRVKAVTEVEQLVLGKKYYSNDEPYAFVLKEILTQGEMCARKNLSYGDKDAVEWFTIESEYGDNLYSLYDNNIGASYNPWLIFEKEQDRDDCVNELKVEYIDEGDYNTGYDDDDPFEDDVTYDWD